MKYERDKRWERENMEERKKGDIYVCWERDKRGKYVVSYTEIK